MSFLKGFLTTLGVISAIGLVSGIAKYGLTFLSWAKEHVISGYHLVVNFCMEYPLVVILILLAMLSFSWVNKFRRGSEYGN